MENTEKKQKRKVISAAFSFIILMAFVSMFSDMVHEGANSIIGDFESLAGASTLAIAITSGIGVFIGYSFRLFTGFLADKTKKYWLFTIIGYFVDLVTIPLLALVAPNGWFWACLLIVIEKMAKAIKKPAKNTLVSFAAKQNGTGKSFAIGELLDQLGAFIGPLILTVTYLIIGDIDRFTKMRIGFLVLGIPALICFSLLLTAHFKYKNPEQFEKDKPELADKKLFSTSFIFFIIASCFLAIGFIDFPVFTKHAASMEIFANYQDYLPLLYSYTMLIDAISALIFGLLYDKKGFLAIVISTILSIAYSFFMFLTSQLPLLIVGMTMWGITMGAQESIILAAVSDLSSKKNRAKAFGIYDTIYGFSWLLGSTIMGYLYDISLLGMSIFSCVSLCISTILFIISWKYKKIDDNEVSSISNK